MGPVMEYVIKAYLDFVQKGVDVYERDLLTAEGKEAEEIQDQITLIKAHLVFTRQLLEEARKAGL
jgi:hypothetical protein